MKEKTRCLDNNNGITFLTNCRILLPDETLSSNIDGHDWVCFDSHTGSMIEVHATSDQNPSAFINSQTITFDRDVHVFTDCQNNIVSPGFVDIQLNGAYGVDFSDRNISFEDIDYVRRKLLETGVTSFFPTIISSTPEDYSTLLPLYQRYLDSDRKVDGARILGLHLEGPFFHKSKRGAHNEKCIIEDMRSQIIDNDDVLQDPFDRFCYTYGKSFCPSLVRIVTLAPELPGAAESIRVLSERGVIVSMGHTTATLEDGIRGLRNGARLVTHLYNAMKPFHHREPGLVGLLGHNNRKAERCFFSIISDGIHCHPNAVNIAAKASSKSIILVTDAMSAMGLEDGIHSLGSVAVRKQGTRATVASSLEDSTSEVLAGSVVTMIDCVKNFLNFTGCRPEEAICKCTHNVRELGAIKTTGIIQKSMDADLVVLNNKLEVISTWVKGVRAYIK